MTSLQKGSALPRGLSLSDTVYLAPVFSSGQNSRVSVAIRHTSKEVSFFEASCAEIKNWAENETHLGAEVLKQLAFLENLDRYDTIVGQQTPLIMGIVNVTPDSFSDGGKYHSVVTACDQARALTEAGAHILDIGGESTRPGADFVSEDEELERVIPVINKCKDMGPLISIDTRKSIVMKRAVEAGAGIINDVTALEFDTQSMQVAAEQKVPVCLMHSSADPKVMQDQPEYDHVLFDVINYLKTRIESCLEMGMTRDQIFVDPGVGFGKTLEHNLVLLKGLRFFHGLGCPILLGVSRKSFISKVDKPSEATERIGGSLSSLLYGLSAGVQIFRVHDVEETRQATAIWQSIEKTSLTI